MKPGLLLTTLFFALISNYAYCQKISVGVKAGTDLLKIKGKSFDEEFKFGYHVGAFAEVKVKKIGIQPEVYFSQVNAKSGKTPTDINPNIADVKTIKLSYLNIPILLNYYFNPNVAIQLGPQFGALINENISGQSNVENAFKKGDFSLLGGLQLKISRFRVFGRYIVGLNDKNNIEDAADNSKWKSQTVHLGIGYSFL